MGGTSPAADAFQSVAAEAASMIGFAWPVAVAVMVGLAGIGLFKKFVSKAV